MEFFDSPISIRMKWKKKKSILFWSDGWMDRDLRRRDGSASPNSWKRKNMTAEWPDNVVSRDPTPAADQDRPGYRFPFAEGSTTPLYYYYSHLLLLLFRPDRMADRYRRHDPDGQTLPPFRLKNPVRKDQLS